MNIFVIERLHRYVRGDGPFINSTFEFGSRGKCFFGGRDQRPLVPLLLLSHPFFPIIIFSSTTLFNWDDRHLLALAMASDFSSRS
jgi:hypothetical protein